MYTTFFFTIPTFGFPLMVHENVCKHYFLNDLLLTFSNFYNKKRKGKTCE